MTNARRASEARRIADEIQKAVEKGATTAEEVHRAIVDLPLKVLEEVEVLKQPVKEVRRLQDRAIGAVYDAIRGINQQVGTLASELLAEAGARKGAHKTHKSRASAGHAATHSRKYLTPRRAAPADSSRS